MLGGTSRDRQRCPEIADEIGEDPARYLDKDLMTPEATRLDVKTVDHGHNRVRRVPDGHVDSAGRMARDRIESIDDLDVLEEWFRVEAELLEREDAPRKAVLGWLDDRRSELEEIGERPDRLMAGPTLPPAWTFEPSRIELDRPKSVQAKIAEKREAVATDGGEDVDGDD